MLKFFLTFGVILTFKISQERNKVEGRIVAFTLWSVSADSIFVCVDEMKFLYRKDLFLNFIIIMSFRRRQSVAHYKVVTIA